MIYKITLKPTGSFYFGGENSFGEAKARGNSEDDIAKNYFSKRSAYFAKGEMFPQQTQLLGMLRKEIMRKHACLKLHNSGECIEKGKKNDAVRLVGLNWKANLGQIKQLSPLFLEKEGELYVPSPMDKGLSLVKKEGASYINGRKSDVSYAFKNTDDTFFNAKDAMSDDYISETSSLTLNSVFKPVTRIGNQTLGYTEDDEEQLYKITAYKLQKEVHFVCYLQTKEDLFGCVQTETYESIVELGGERSTFKLEVMVEDEIPNYQEIYEQDVKQEARVILMSDSYVDVDIFSSCDIVLSQKVPFRTISSNKHGFSKSSKEVLLKKGTVFYPKEDTIMSICESISEAKEFQKIGYNQYIIIDNK